MSFSGRLFLIAHETTPSGGTYTTIAGQQDSTVKINNQIVDVTTKDDAGIRQLLNYKVGQSISFSGSGVCKDSATLKFLRDTALASTHINFRITTPGDGTSGVTYTGAFVITGFEEGGEDQGEWKFSCSFESAGTITVAALT